MYYIKITSIPFSWNDNLSEEAMDYFDGIRTRLSYCSCQSIGMALAKLELIERLMEEGKIDIDLDL